MFFFYIETRNTPLEEIARHFDGDAAIIGGAAGTEKSRELAATLHIEETTVNKDGMIAQETKV